MQDFDMENQLAQQRYQQALAEQNKPLSSPQGKMVGNIYVRSNPMEALISGLRMKQAKDELGASRQELKDLQGKRQSAIADALRGFGEKSTGAPAVASATTPTQMPTFDDADAATMQGVSGYGATTGAQAARAPDLRGAYADLMAAPDASLRNAGMQGMIQMPQLEAAKLEKQEARQFRMDEAAATRQARMDALAQQHQDRMAAMEAQNATRQQMAQEQRQFQMQMAQMNMQNQREMQQLTLANRPERQAQIIDTDQGKMRVMPSGQLEPLMDTQGNMISGPKGPQGTLARENEAKQALAAIKQAETLLPKATSSGLGSAVDATAAFFGASTPGAQAASQLKALEGELVSKMPKMSGPQSDKDVALYKQMAGVIGDQTQPVATRQAALATVKEIQKRYAGQPADAGANPQDAAALQWARSNPNDPRSRAILQRLGQ